MTDWPLLGIALLTYRRTDLAVRAVKGMLEHARYSGHTLWYIADDGSPVEHMHALHDLIGGDLIGFHSERMGPGPSWNKAVARIADQTPYIMWLEDDWELRRDLDLDRYVKLLAESGLVGMVRLGHLPVNLHLESVGYDGTHYLNVLKDRQYCYSGNPSIRHYRHFEAYGGYPTDQRSAGECETFHDSLVRDRPGPQVWWPVDLGGWGIFGHIGEEKA